MSSDAESSSSKQLPSKVEADAESLRKLPDEVDAEASSSKQLPTKVKAEAENPRKLPDEKMDAKASVSKQLPTKAEVESESLKKLFDEVDAEAKNLNQLPDTKAGSSIQLPDKADTESGSSEQLPNKMLLRSMDGEEFEVDTDVAMQSGTIKNMIEEESNGTCLPLPNVSGATLAMILEFFNRHRCDGEMKPRESMGFFDQFEPDPREEELRKFDKEFVKNMDKESLLDLTVAADYLFAKKLLDVTCQALADTIENMSVEDVREYFNIVNDYTPEEEEKVRNENEWAFE